MEKAVGFIGLGQMGRWMALNLIKKGFHLTVFDVNREAVAFLEKNGAKAVRTPAELAAGVSLTILSLPGSRETESVVLGDNGLVHGWKADGIVVDLGTADYLWTRNFSKKLAQQGIRFADAPVSGMEKRAKNATLTIMFGGVESVLEETRPVLEAMASNVIYTGVSGTGQLAKMINNILFNTNIAALAEVLPMAVKLGLEPESIARVINSGTGGSFASETFIPKILKNRFDGGYPLEKAYKDMTSAGAAAARNKIPIPMVQAATTTYRMAMASGYGHEDKGAMIKFYEQLLGVGFRKKKSP
jgi:3-hydroxyisobutyrate dehydrogenase-like beta-hydroxyacid dehydrogenase